MIIYFYSLKGKSKNDRIAIWEVRNYDQAVKKFKLEPLNVYTAKAKAKELNVEEVLYMNVQKNKYAYIVKDGARGYVLYQDEKSIYSKMYKGLKMTPLEP